MMTDTKRKKKYTGRDTLMVRLINGATKSYVAEDQRRKESKQACRRWDLDEELLEEDECDDEESE